MENTENIKMRPAVFLDRDGTINIDKRYIHKIEDFEYLDRVPEALKLLNDAGFLLIIITNQSGIARGYYSEEDYRILNEWMLADFKNKGIKIDGTYYCPHHPEGIIPQYRRICNCRKPKTGLFEQAISNYRIDVERSYAVGDRRRDLAICGQTAVQGILLTEQAEHEFGANEEYNKRIWKCSNLFEAAQMILQNFYETEESND